MGTNKKAEILSKRLIPNLRVLSGKIARKPPQHDHRWAKSITESFTFYTRTSTIDKFTADGQMLKEFNWPFPAFLDLQREVKHSLLDVNRFLRGPFAWMWWSPKSLSMSLVWHAGFVVKDEAAASEKVDILMCRLFNRSSHEVFDFWLNHPLLGSSPRVALLRDVIKVYKLKAWGACVITLFPLLDYVMREYLDDDNLTTGVGTVAEAFDLAGITYEALLPGVHGVIVRKKSGSVIPPELASVVGELENDLRLPGIYLASFIEFSRKFYAFHNTANKATSNSINRHAALHGDVTYCSEAHAVRLLVFFDLALKLEPVLRIILADEPKE